LSIHNIQKKKLFLIINRLALASIPIDVFSTAFYLKDKYDITVVYGEKEKDEKEAPLSLIDNGFRFIKIKTLRRSILPLKDIQRKLPTISDYITFIKHFDLSGSFLRIKALNILNAV
jgi:hypothetical protein